MMQQQQQQPPPPPCKKLARVDTQELRARLFKQLGNQRAELYFRSLKRFLNYQLGKEEFDRICTGVLGKENVKLHNVLVRSILRNACTAAAPPPSKQAATGNSQTSNVTTLNGSGVVAARRIRPPPVPASRERRFGDKPSPLGKSPLGHPGGPGGEFVSIGSKSPLEVISVEDGEEVDQARWSTMCVQSRSPIRAPLGVATAQNSLQRPSTSCSLSLDVCYNNGELPDSVSLSKLLEDKLKLQGFSVAGECADALNSGLNAYLGQMLQACLGVAKARGNEARMHPPNGGAASASASASAAAVNSGQQQGVPVDAGCSYQASLLDLWTAVQLNSNARLVLGFTHQGEKIASHFGNR